MASSIQPSASQLTTEYSESEILSLTDVLGCAIAISGGHAAKKRLILNHLTRIIQADAWAWTLHKNRTPRPPLVIDHMKAGFCNDSFALYLKSLGRCLPSEKRILSNGVPTTLVPRPDLGMRYCLMIDISHHSETRSTLAFFRKQNTECFSGHEIGLSALMAAEIPWLNEKDFPTRNFLSTKNLPRRMASVMELLIKGCSRKEIGSCLGIQLNTVHGYVGSLYARLGIRSHAELLQLGTQLPPSPPPPHG